MGNQKKENYSSDTETIVKEDNDISEPSLYKVILLNDHYTTMEFVVYILEYIFNKSRIEAESIMLSVHHAGLGVAGIYVKEIAETKINEVHNLAKKNEFPLKCKLEKA